MEATPSRGRVGETPERFVLCRWGAPPHREVPWVAAPHAPSAQARDAVATARPFRVRGLQDGTVAAERWSFDDLRARWGHLELPVIALRDGMLSYDTRRGIAYESRPLAEVLDDLGRDDSPRWYVSTHPDAYLPGFTGEARTPVYTDGATWRASRVWIGSGGTTTPIHRELTDNVLCVFSGEKELVLFGPREYASLEPHAPWSGIPHLSRVDPRATHVARKTRRVTPWRCTLGAGDAIFIPRGWWHAVRTTGPSIALNYWWARGSWALVPRAADLYKRVFGLSV